MVDFSKTISNQLNVHGMQPSNRWGTMLWNQLWGGYDIDLEVGFGQELDLETINLTESWSKASARIISETVTMSQDLTHEGLTDPAGYNYLFDGVSVNAESRVFTSYTTSANGTSTYVQVSNPSTSWSDQ